MKPASPKKPSSAAARREMLAVMRRLEEEPEHVLQVARLALQIFDGLKAWHQLGRRERLLLEAAAGLHDIGWSVASDGSKHHKHSARLIRKQKWQHFAASEIDLIAQVARYHRKSPPMTKHRAFAALPESEQRKVSTLASLLRVADALDRRHLQVVQRVCAHLEDGVVVFEIDAPRSVSIEAAAGQKKGNLLRRLTQRELVFHWTGLHST